MKNIKKYLAMFASSLVLVGCGAGGESEEASDIVTEVPENTEVTFWHAMNGAQEEALEKMTADFMEENENIDVVLQNQASYPDLQAKINTNLISPKDLPTMTQAYPNWLWNAVMDELVVDLTPYIEHDTIGLENKDDVIPSLMDASVIEDVQYGMPFNKSAEVLYYNADLLEEYDVEVPTTMEELAEASKTIYEKSDGEVVGAGFDSLNNYYAIGMKNEGIDINEDLDVTSEESQKVVNYYFDGIKEGYFRIAGSDGYLSGPFGAETIAMNVGSMAGESHIRSGSEGNFEYGVANRPSEINLSQGTDLYIFDSATAEERTAAFEYMKYLVSEDAQLYWALETGYMPVRTSVLGSDEYINNDQSKISAIIGETTENMFTIPVLENADPVYNLAREMMEKILSDENSDVEQELENFQAEYDATWEQ